MEAPPPASPDLDGALLKARVKAKLLGRMEAVRIGRFELLRRCGQGGEGTVYEALDPTCQRRVALKCLHPNHAAAGASLRREFRALSQLVHPNLAVLYELFCTGGQWFHTMELLDGVDFGSHVSHKGERGPPFDEPKLRAALIQLLCGLYAIHAAGKVHRDLKPSNVLVQPGGRVVIVDYGLMIEQPSTTAGPSPKGAQRVGTPAYMAPEQMRAESVSSAADLYAVGVILFEALTGQRARPGAAPDTARLEQVGITPLGQPSHTLPADLASLCADLLSEDPRRRPSAEQALTRLGGRPIAPLRFRPSSAECFVGRADQLQALHAAHARSLSGHATCVLIHGESGIGKTALLAKFCAELGSRPVILRGRCYERENTPYKVFDAVIEALVEYLDSLPESLVGSLLPRELAALTQVFPAFLRLRGTSSALHVHTVPKDPLELRHAAFSAARQLLQQLCDARDVVLCIDDLHWGDVDSIRLLQHVFAAPSPPALLFVGAYRRTEVHTSAFLRHAVVERTLEGLGWDFMELSLEPLDLEEARALVRASKREGESLRERVDALDAQIREARGVPFVLVELAEQNERAASVPNPTTTARDVVRLRAERCSSPAHSLLNLLCVAGRPLEIRLILHLLQDDTDAWSAAAELCAARLARWRDTLGERCLEPYHDLIGEVVAADESSEELRSVHAAIARTMQALDIDAPEHLVHHLIGSGERRRGGEVAIVAARRAAQKLAWDSAAQFYGLALELLSERDASRYPLHEQHGEALARAGRHAASATAYLRAAGFTGGAANARLLRNASQQLMRAGDADRAIELFKRLMHDAGLRYPESEYAALTTYLTGCLRRKLTRHLDAYKHDSRPPRQEQRLATLATIYSELWLVDPVRALAVHSWFFEEARHAPDHYWLQALTGEVAHLSAMYGARALPRISQLLSEIDALATRRGQPYELALARLARSICLIHAEQRPRDALQLLRETDQLFTTQCSGVHFERSWLALLRDYALEATGHFTELTESVLRRERECNEREDGYTLKQLLLSLPTVMLLQDRPEAALTFLQTRWRRSTGQADLSDFAALTGSASALLYMGDARGSFEVLDREWSWLKESGMLRGAALSEHGNFCRARAAAALYCDEPHPGWKREARRRNPLNLKPSLPTYIFHTLIEASLAWADGRDHDCRDSLESAARSFASIQHETCEWTVRYRLAQLHRSAEGMAEASSWLSTRGLRNPERWASLLVPVSASARVP